MSLTFFRREHLQHMDIKADARDVAETPGVPDRLEELGAKSILTADGKKVLAVMGVAPVLPGVCEVFVLASEDQARYPVTFAKAVRKELYTIRAKYRRIQAIAKDDSFHARWLGWLGFEREGVLKKFGRNGEDMVMWGLV
jgi:hypothetical protein